MQQAIPYKSWVPLYTNNKLPLNLSTPPPPPPPQPQEGSGQNHASNVIKSGEIVNGSAEDMKRLVLENSIIVFARKGCCLSHVVKRLLLGLGVNPAVYEIDDEKDEAIIVQQLENMVIKRSALDHGVGSSYKKVQLPAVFIGGKLFGGLDRIMATHISGELVPILKEAGALWL